MYYLDDIYQEIASKYVLKGNQSVLNEDLFYNADGFSGPGNNIKNKIYGIAQSKRQGNKVLEVYYDKSVAFEKISAELIPYSRNAEIYGFPTSKFKTFQLQGGDAIAHTKFNGYGTLGGFVLDAFSNKVLILSNNHVIANCNNARVGDAIVDHPQREYIGQLERFEPLLTPPNRNTIDAAVGSIAKIHFSREYAQYRQTPARPQVGMKVHKVGANTGLTHGTIISTNAAIIVDYEQLGTINFVNALVIRGDKEPFSMPGDSGSFIINDTGYLIGIVFAGDPNGSISFGNSIDEIVNLLGLRF